MIERCHGISAPGASGQKMYTEPHCILFWSILNNPHPSLLALLFNLFSVGWTSWHAASVTPGGSSAAIPLQVQLGVSGVLLRSVVGEKVIVKKTRTNQSVVASLISHSDSFCSTSMFSGVLERLASKGGNKTASCPHWSHRQDCLTQIPELCERLSGWLLVH